MFTNKIETNTMRVACALFERDICFIVLTVIFSLSRIQLYAVYVYTIHYTCKKVVAVYVAATAVAVATATATATSIVFAWQKYCSIMMSLYNYAGHCCIPVIFCLFRAVLFYYLYVYSLT